MPTCSGKSQQPIESQEVSTAVTVGLFSNQSSYKKPIMLIDEHPHDDLFSPKKLVSQFRVSDEEDEFSDPVIDDVSEANVLPHQKGNKCQTIKV